ncbi:MAG: hypothetical protein CMLOHMNK_03330 [Steroidobacteraceae bacterium]|nr:hypothetical protein [Steroidobacteraceae bacterium]
MAGGVKSIEQVGYDIGPRPTHCLACGRAGTLVSHGQRPRKVWWPNGVWVSVVFVFRLRCGRYPIDLQRCCGKTLTLLPGCLYPYRRYPLEVIQSALVLRFVVTASWRHAGQAVRVAESTLRDWCCNFSQAAHGWLTGLLHWFSHSPQFATPSAVETTPEAGLLSTAGVCMDLREQEASGKPVREPQILQRLWEWGFERLNRIPLLSTRFPEGGPAPVRPRGRDPDP